MTTPVSFVSLGPGAPDLMTVRTVETLKRSQLVFCPSTLARSGGTVSRAAGLVAAAGVPEERIRLFHVPMESDRGAAMEAYRRTAEEIAVLHRQGKRIAVTVEGDAGIYASIHYMIGLLEERQIPVRQCCGIPSFIAAAEPGCLSLISQEERLVVIPGTATCEELERYLQTSHVPVIMKLSRCREAVRTFIGLHPEYAYHYLENIASAEQEYYTTDPQRIREREFPYFSLLIIKR